MPPRRRPGGRGAQASETWYATRDAIAPVVRPGSQPPCPARLLGSRPPWMSPRILGRSSRLRFPAARSSPRTLEGRHRSARRGLGLAARVPRPGTVISATPAAITRPAMFHCTPARPTAAQPARACRIRCPRPRGRRRTAAHFRGQKLRQKLPRQAERRPPRSRIVPGQRRWRWDLNPRKGCPLTRFRVLRTTVHRRPPMFMTSANRRPAAAGERPGTRVNETQTEPTPRIDRRPPTRPWRARSVQRTGSTQSQVSPLRRSVSSGCLVRIASRAAMIRPVVALARR